jgi:alkanesulfonate monooxygenase
MTIRFIGYIEFSNTSELHGAGVSRDLDPEFAVTVAKAQEYYGFDQVLIPFSSHSPDGLIIASHVAHATSRLGFIVAHRPGFTQPTVAARQFATLDRLSGGRLAVHVITGGSDAELARDGDHLDKDARYRRTDEFITLLRRTWQSGTPFDHAGEFYRVTGAHSDVKPAGIDVFFGGASAPAIAIAGRQADVYALWGETLDQVADLVGQVRAAAAPHGRSPGFSISLRPIIADTEEAAWAKARAITEQVRENRLQAGLPIDAHTPQNVGSQRLLETVARGFRADKALWTGIAALGGGQGNSTGLVGTPDQVADALLDYHALGIDTFLVRGFEPLHDAVLLGQELLPLVRRRAARLARIQ